MNWTPFGSTPDDRATLVDGTPEWMLNSLRQRFSGEFRQYVRTDHYGNGYHQNRVDRMRRMELETRLRPVANVLNSKGVDTVFGMLIEQERLRVFDWTIRDNVEKGEHGNDDLERILRDGGSKWMVGTRDGVPGLEDRVPQGVQDAADAAMATSGDAG